MTLHRHLNAALASVDETRIRVNALTTYLFREREALIDFINKTFEDLVKQVEALDDTLKPFDHAKTLEGTLNADDTP